MEVHIIKAIAANCTVLPESFLYERNGEKNEALCRTVQVSYSAVSFKLH